MEDEIYHEFSESGEVLTFNIRLTVEDDGNLVDIHQLRIGSDGAKFILTRDVNNDVIITPGEGYTLPVELKASSPIYKVLMKIASKHLKEIEH